MQRLTLEPRPGWTDRLAALGMELEADAVSPYWREDAAYAFTGDEIETLHGATETLLGMLEAATAHVIETNRFADLGIPDALAALARQSWERDDATLYGRLDLRFDATGPPKLLEYNADTPTALFEAAVVQWHWLEERFPGADQYNSIHEALIATWTEWRRQGRLSRVHFACMPEDDDDLLTTAYLQDTAVQAGVDGHLIELPQIGWDGRQFVDQARARIEALFKLYPWDWLAEEAFFAHLAASPVKVLEPAWRVVPSSKGILAILWELFPGHPYLLPAAFDPARIDGPLILKPMHGREGANMIVGGGAEDLRTDGPYAAMARVAQSFAPLPDFDGWRPVVGAWTIAGEACGIGMREDRDLITGRGARFVPHLMRG